MVMTLPELRRICNDIKDHFDKAQRLHEKVLRHGSTMRSMEGFCHKTDDETSQVRLTLINMPFVQLKGHGHGTQAKLDPRAIAEKLLGRPLQSPSPAFQHGSYAANAHTMRTLFQYLNPRQSSRRDLKQVVCHMLDPNDKRYLHVSQLWVLLINEG